MKKFVPLSTSTSPSPQLVPQSAQLIELLPGSYFFDDTSQTYQVELLQPGEYQLNLTTPKVKIKVQSRIKLSGAKTFKLTVTIIHAASETQAEVLFLGTAENRSILDIQGKIVVAKNSLNCQSFLTERVLLLDDTAKAMVVPELEILNNQVKCSHAASVSFIPGEQIFYLMSRGLSESEAITQIAEGFLNQPMKSKS